MIKKKNQIMWKCGFENWISDIKIDQNHRKFVFSMVFMDSYNVLIEIRKFDNQYMTLIIIEWAGIKMRLSL